MRKQFIYNAITFILAILIIPISSAFALNNNSATLTANSNTFSIDYGGSIYDECIVDYDLIIIPNNEDQGTSDINGAFFVPADSFDGFFFNELWDSTLYGSFTISGQLTFNYTNGYTDTMSIDEFTLLKNRVKKSPFSPKTPDYWLSNPSAWKATELMIGANVYTQAELLEILKKEQVIYNNMFNMVHTTLQNYHRNENLDTLLTKQLIATKLNIEAGSSFAIEVKNAVIDADSYLESPENADKDHAINLKSILETYNANKNATKKVVINNDKTEKPASDNTQKASFLTKTPKFWKSNPQLWPVYELTIGSIDYTQAELLNMLEVKIINNMFNMVHQNLQNYLDHSNENLVRELIAAELNIAAGADCNKHIKNTVTDANNYLDKTIDDDPTALTAILANYNKSN